MGLQSMAYTAKPLASLYTSSSSSPCFSSISETILHIYSCWESSKVTSCLEYLANNALSFALPVCAFFFCFTVLADDKYFVG